MISFRLYEDAVAHNLAFIFVILFIAHKQASPTTVGANGTAAAGTTSPIARLGATCGTFKVVGGGRRRLTSPVHGGDLLEEAHGDADWHEMLAVVSPLRRRLARRLSVDVSRANLPQVSKL